ncbi:hypothetical protein [Aureimonas sp. ME7]|uniref:lysozyme inhibitor LprI family protein n=1 Tax=Aureimonas sp. ME7 TaxID=2744252 RepID=UPI0015F705E4|nr:hypothetical protein [Aureimonas sp. ME7]
MLRSAFLALSLASAFLFLHQADAAPRAKPSFDCRKAHSWSERAICDDPQSAALDRRIDRRFAELAKRFGQGGARNALRADQNAFLGIREWLRPGVDGDPREWLRDLLGERAEMLDRIRPQGSSDLVGTWRNAWGEFELRPLLGNRVRIYGTVSEPFTGRWTCEVDEIGSRQGDKLLFVPTDGGDWRIRAHADGGVLFLDGFSGAGDEIASTYCGDLATVEDAFFLVGPISDSPPEDW